MCLLIYQQTSPIVKLSLGAPAEQCALTSANQNTVHLKLVSFESLAGNDFSERGTQAEATQQRRT